MPVPALYFDMTFSNGITYFILPKGPIAPVVGGSRDDLLLPLRETETECTGILKA